MSLSSSIASTLCCAHARHSKQIYYYLQKVQCSSRSIMDRKIRHNHYTNQQWAVDGHTALSNLVQRDAAITDKHDDYPSNQSETTARAATPISTNQESRPSRHRKEWADNDLEDLRKMYLANESLSAIAGHLQRTEEAVRIKLRLQTARQIGCDPLPRLPPPHTTPVIRPSRHIPLLNCSMFSIHNTLYPLINIPRLLMFSSRLLHCLTCYHRFVRD